MSRLETLAGDRTERTLLSAGPYGKRAIELITDRACSEVATSLESERRWFRALPPSGAYRVLGNVEGPAIRLVVQVDHRDFRKFEFRGTLEPIPAGGTRVQGVIQTHPAHRWIIVPIMALATVALITLLAVRVAHGDSLLHPFFFTALAIVVLVGTATDAVPALMPETFEGSRQAIIAYLEEKVGERTSVL